MTRTTTIDADGRTIEVHFLMTRGEADLNARPYLCGPVAPGVERRWLERARRADEHSDHVGRKESLRRAAIWGDIANRLWPGACASLVGGLPELDAFFVIPSSRPNRRDPLVHALRARFPTAIEIVYTRSDGVRFGDATEDTIFDALCRTEPATIPIGSRITIADDWAGGGTTLRASARRLIEDYAESVASINAAVPGVSAIPIQIGSRP